MSTGQINFNKPCNSCRRRKVKCDKNQPCAPCVRHGTAATCAYDVSRESSSLPANESQQQLQDRVDRLERVIEEMKTMALRGEPLKIPNVALVSPSPASLGDVYLEDSMAGDPGMQVYDENVSFYLGPNYWLNLQDYVFEPRHLFLIDSDKNGKSPDSPPDWPIGRNPTLPDLAHLHLPPEKEDVLTDLFFAHVEPFVRIFHETYWRQQIRDARLGVSKIPVDVEVAMFAAQTMTVAAMPARLIRDKIGKPKDEVLRHLQEVSRLALERADILRSRKPLAFVALLYHIQMKFITGNGETAVSLLGLAGRFGTRLGLHRDPSNYNYSPWTSNMRRRIWSHFEFMDNPVYNLEGADSGLPFISDSQPPKNANESQWNPTPFAKPGSAPTDQDGITDMSFVLVRHCLSKTMQSLIRRRNDASPEELGRIIDHTDSFLKTKFMNHVVPANPDHAVLCSHYRVSLKSMRLLVHQVHAHYVVGPDPLFRAKFYQECVEILEEIEQGEEIAVQHRRGWIYRWPTTPCLISNVLIGLRDQPSHPITDRAWRQINVAFRRHNNDDINMRKFAAWRVIEALCDEAMLYHKQVSHEGAWYSRRHDAFESKHSAKGKEPVSLKDATVLDILADVGDVQMFGQHSTPQGGVVGGSVYFEHQALQPMNYALWGQPGQHPVQTQSQSQVHASDDHGEM
ncbi:C6 transcription factor [Colletotrichum truncatum]|uniref:C6 transcription factor n=1 Tax=Colletotrichum truncatum TaxID=5467 RepID=A0ACC3YES2_COLTU|nr:C6 transcription factor [Colletotrichum truncatum]KAF6783233.1 C6 transcription factor [Colletotrichum truncatum]